MSLQRIVIDSPLSAVGFQSVCDLAPGRYQGIQALQNYLGAVSAGLQAAKLTCLVGAVQASGLLTVSAGGSSAAETCVILNVTFTARASAPAANEFVISATAATQAANMAAAINASADLAGKVTATSLLGVVTITAVSPGLAGNGLQLSEALANVALTAFASGVDGTETVINFL